MIRFILLLMLVMPVFCAGEVYIGFIQDFEGSPLLNNKPVKKKLEIRPDDVLSIPACARVRIQFHDGSVRVYKKQTITFTVKKSKKHKELEQVSNRAMEIIGIKG